MDAETQSDHDLYRQLRDGSEAACSVLYQRHHQRIYRFALAMCGSVEQAEEALQDVFLDLIEGRAGYDPSRGQLQPYLLGMARHRILNAIRASGREESMDGSDADYAAGGDLELDLTRDQTVALVRDAVAALPLRYREPLVLCELEELGYADAAEVLGCPVGTVKSRLSRAKAMLFDRLRAGARSVA